MRIMPCRIDGGLGQELDRLRANVENLQRESDVNPHLQSSRSFATLMHYAEWAFKEGIALHTTKPVTESGNRFEEGPGAYPNGAGWVERIDTGRPHQRKLDSSNRAVIFPRTIPRGQGRNVKRRELPILPKSQQVEHMAPKESDSEDDLDTDLAKAALSTGEKAFQSKDWTEADSLLQEALLVLQQIPPEKRTFCDIFSLHYRLAVCAYHIQESAVAEEALKRVAHQAVDSDEQRECRYEVAHLLSHLYIRMGQVDRARTECEAALQGRRKLLGKRSDAALESTALAAHIYFLLDNSARAKSYLAMIPDERKDIIIKAVESTLDAKVELLSSPSLSSRPGSENLGLVGRNEQDGLSSSSLVTPMENVRISQSSTASSIRSHQRIPSYETSPPSEHRRVFSIKQDSVVENPTPDPAPQILGSYKNAPLSLSTLPRKEILNRIKCQPRDRIEDAVCEGDHEALTKLLARKKGSWRLSFRKSSRTERVTALHFAALFGELEMARQLLEANFNVNEVPYGYTATITPLTFAIGARQVKMVEFLIENGARPQEPDSWSTMAGQLMNRSWLAKTLSSGENEDAPARIIAILKTLLKSGLDVNATIDTSGRTLLHQAVAFWTGEYTWDLGVRVKLTEFLHGEGADPWKPNAEGKTPRNLAEASGHEELLMILDRSSVGKKGEDRTVEPVELPADPVRWEIAGGYTSMK